MKEQMEVFEFSTLKQNDSVIYYKDKFFLGDNLGKKFDFNTYGRYLNVYPVKPQFSMVMFCLKGGLKIRINFNDYELSAYNSAVIIPNTLCQVLEISEDAELIIMAFADDTFFTSMSINEMSDFYNILQASPILNIPKEKFNVFLNIYQLMRADIGNADFSCKEDALMGYIQVILSHAKHWISSYNSKIETVHNRSTQIYLNFIELVHKFHSQHRDVTFYAEQLCLSSKYLSQVILSVSGKYALDIIKEQVIFEAKALLKSHRYSVQEVAYMLNFPNPSFFGKYFRGEVGMSPRTYMNYGEG